MLVRSVVARPRRICANMLAIVLAGALSLVVAASADAAERPLVGLDVTLLVQSQGTGGPLMLVAGQLPEGTQLPAEMVLPVPEGAVVEWSGEILGGAAEDDIPTEARIEQRDGASVVVFTLTQSLVGQAEVSYPNAVVAGDGSARTGSYDLIAPVDAEASRVAVALPPGGRPTWLPEGTLSAEGPQGDTYYYLELNGVTAGDPLAMNIQFTLDAVQPSTGAGQRAPGAVPPILIILIAAVLAGALLILFASRSRSGAAVATDEVALIEEAGLTEAVAADDRENVEPVKVLDAESSGTDAEAAPSETDTATETPAPASISWLTPRLLVIIAGVLVIGIVVALILGGQGDRVGVTEISNGVISQRISEASGESTVELNTIITCECPPEAEVPKMFDALRTVPGVAHASVEESTLRMRVEYDPAVTDETAISAVLRQSGYLP